MVRWPINSTDQEVLRSQLAQVENKSFAGSDRAGKASDRAPRAMVQASTKGRCFKGGRYKDLVHAVLDLHLQVALLTV